jgi:hypothetical protein
MTWSRTPATWIFCTAGALLLLAGGEGIALATGAIGAREAWTIIIVFSAIGLLLIRWGRSMWRRYAVAQRLRTEGVRGRAAVVLAQQTGQFLNRQPQVRLRLRVTTPVHGTYRAEVTDYVPLTAVGRLSDGVPLTVLVDRDDRTTLVVDWR